MFSGHQSSDLARPALCELKKRLTNMQFMPASVQYKQGRKRTVLSSIAGSIAVVAIGPIPDPGL
jgi:hypothetical protein